MTVTLLSIPAAAELLDGTPRHVVELGENGDLVLVDIAVHRSRPGKTVGSDGRNYPKHKRRLRVTAESLRAFIVRRTIGQPQLSRRRRRKPEGIIDFF